MQSFREGRAFDSEERSLYSATHDLMKCTWPDFCLVATRNGKAYSMIKCQGYFRAIMCVIAPSVCGSTAFALQGVVKQTIITPDAVQLDWGSFTFRLSGDPIRDATRSEFPRFSIANGGKGQYNNWAQGSSFFDAEQYGDASSEVAVCEGQDFYNNGNYSNGDGLRTNMSLSDTLDVDYPYVQFTPADNPSGVATVEIVQKVHAKNRIKNQRNDADSQTKYYYSKVANTMVDGGLRESTFQWTASTVTATTVGANASLKINGEVQAGVSWSQTVNQGTDGFEHLMEAVHEATRTLTFSAADATTHQQSVTIDAGVEWNLSIVDDTWPPIWVDCAELEGTATYCTVIGFGEITITHNTDGSTTPAQRLGIPERTLEIRKWLMTAKSALR